MVIPIANHKTHGSLRGKEKNTKQKTNSRTQKTDAARKRRIGACEAVEVGSFHWTFVGRRATGKVFSFSVAFPIRNRLLFWGNSTNRYLLTSKCTNYAYPEVYCIDLEKCTCERLFAFPKRENGQDANISCLTSSGSGRTIAAFVEEDNTASVCVASVDVDTKFVFSFRVFACEDIGRGQPLPLCNFPCFIGPSASDLVVVDDKGNIHNLGRENGSEMEFKCVSRVPYLGNVFAEGRPEQMNVNSVCHVSGSNSLLALVSNNEYGEHDVPFMWEVVHVVLEDVNPAFDTEVHWTRQVVIPMTSGQELLVDDVSHAVGVGVTVSYRAMPLESPYSYWFPTLLSMKLGRVRKAWMMACIRSTERK